MLFLHTWSLSIKAATDDLIFISLWFWCSHYSSSTFCVAAFPIVGTFGSSNQLTDNDLQKILKSIKVFFNERHLSCCWITERAYGAKAPGPGYTQGLMAVMKNERVWCSDTVRQHLHFISRSACIYLQCHQAVAPSKLKSNISDAVSFCCFWKISSKKAVCDHCAWEDFTFNQMALNNLQTAFLLCDDKEKISH